MDRESGTGVLEGSKAGACIAAMDYAQGWDEWKDKFKDAIQQGRRFGLSDGTIQQLSVKIGDFLANRLCAKTKEEELLKDLWTAATPEERRVLAGVVFKVIEQS